MKKYPIVEIFGPTIQGEGPSTGNVAIFVRFGGCDFRCIWCDTKYAVEPKEVRQNSVMMSVEEIWRTIADRALDGVTGDITGVRDIVLTGGNPLIHNLLPFLQYSLRWDNLPKDIRWLVSLRHRSRITVETQGSVCPKNWETVSRLLDDVIISPKPPSSGMPYKVDQGFKQFGPTRNLWSGRRPILKVVVFSDEDFDFACRVAREWRKYGVATWLSIGTSLEDVNQPWLEANILEDTRRLADKALKTHLFVGITPQLHTLIWGGERGR